jgi:thiosulfate/3-mercaptopyruvate sulfurtransferase
MKNDRFIAAALLICIASMICAKAEGATGQCGGHADRSAMLVSTSWLSEHLHDTNLVVVAIGDKKDYDQGHIPGSLFAPETDFYGKGPTGLKVELLPMDQLASVLGKLGVTNESHIVLYQMKNWFYSTMRVYLTLDAIGLGMHTSLLDGGLGQWTKEGRAVSTEAPNARPGAVIPCPVNDVITDLAYVSAHVKRPGFAIVDARNIVFYSGERQAAPELRLGHIPGAGSLPFNSLVDENGKWKSSQELQGLFQAAGVKTGDQVVSYCHVGLQASAVYFAARYLGFDARMYDGSWEEWSAHKELPVESSPGVAPAKQ